MHTYLITVHKYDGTIERTYVAAASEEEARAKFERDSIEFIVSIHEIKHS